MVAKLRLLQRPLSGERTPGFLPRRAFTFIELLATTMLASVLMLAVLGVLSSIGRSEAALARREAASRSWNDMAEMIRQDLAASHRVEFATDRATIWGFSSLDSRSLATTHRPVKIVYRIQDISGQHWLIRDQTSLDVASNRNAWSDLITPGIRSLQFRVVESRVSTVAPKTKTTTRPARPMTQPAKEPAGPDVPKALFGNAGIGTPQRVDLVIYPENLQAPVAVIPIVVR